MTRDDILRMAQAYADEAFYTVNGYLGARHGYVNGFIAGLEAANTWNRAVGYAPDDPKSIDDIIANARAALEEL